MLVGQDIGLLNRATINCKLMHASMIALMVFDWPTTQKDQDFGQRIAESHLFRYPQELILNKISFLGTPSPEFYQHLVVKKFFTKEQNTNENHRSIFGSLGICWLPLMRPKEASQEHAPQLAFGDWKRRVSEQLNETL